MVLGAGERDDVMHYIERWVSRLSDEARRHISAHDLNELSAVTRRRWTILDGSRPDVEAMAEELESYASSGARNRTGRAPGDRAMMQYDARTRAIALEAVANGIDYEWIAANIGPSTRTMQMWARQDGLPRRRTVRGPTPEVRAGAVRLYLEGWRATDVAQVYGVDQRTVNKWVRWAGHQGRGRRGEAPRHPGQREAQRRRSLIEGA